MDNRTTQSFPRRERGLDSFKRTMRRNARRAKSGGALAAVLRGVLIAAVVTVLSVVLFALLAFSGNQPYFVRWRADLKRAKLANEAYARQTAHGAR